MTTTVYGGVGGSLAGSIAARRQLLTLRCLEHLCISCQGSTCQGSSRGCQIFAPAHLLSHSLLSACLHISRMQDVISFNSLIADMNVFSHVSKPSASPSNVFSSLLISIFTQSTTFWAHNLLNQDRWNWHETNPSCRQADDIDRARY